MARTLRPGGPRGAGSEPPIGPLLVVDWAPAEQEGDKILFIFAGGTLGADQLAGIRLQADELRSYDFRDLTGADAILIPRLAVLPGQVGQPGDGG